MGLESYLSDFSPTEGTMQALLDRAKENGIVYDDDDYDQSRVKIETYLKAFIARGIWENDGFFPVLHQQDEIVQQALLLIDEAKNLDSEWFYFG